MAKFITIIYILFLIGTAVAVPISPNQSDSKTASSDKEPCHLTVEAETLNTIRDAFKNTLLQINTPTETAADKPEVNKLTEIKPDASTVTTQERYLLNMLDHHRNCRGNKSYDTAKFINQIQTEVMRTNNNNREIIKYAENINRNLLKHGCTSLMDDVNNLFSKISIISSCLKSPPCKNLVPLSLDLGLDLINLIEDISECFSKKTK